MSLKSRLRLAFRLGNAPRAWGAMVTLTFREQPTDLKHAIRVFGRGVLKTFGPDLQWAWIMEYQGRGVVHYHCFFERERFVDLGLLGKTHTERVVRRGKPCSLLRGAIDSWAVNLWTVAVGDHSREFRRFQNGGIVELLRSEDAAARYVSKEGSKRHQKALPKGVRNAGRWFWTSKACSPQATETAKLTRWPLDFVASRVFDKAALDGCLTDVTPLEESRIDAGRLRD